MEPVPQHVTVVGAGQVGRALAKAMRARRIQHRLVAFRRGIPKQARTTDLVLICVRDAQIANVARQLRDVNWTTDAVVAHVSGALGPDVLAELDPHVRGIGQLHPFSSIRADCRVTHFEGTYFLGNASRAAIAPLRRFVRALGGIFVAGARVERARYHLAAALLANGSVALLRTSRQLLVRAGIEPATASKMLLDLERSVLANVEAVGIESALTGPVRRGDGDTVRRHLELLRSDATARDLYRGLLRAQLQIVTQLGELDQAATRGISRLLGPTRARDQSKR